MNELEIIDNIKIENLVYEVRAKQVMIDSEIYVTKWHYYLVDKIIKLCGGIQRKMLW